MAPREWCAMCGVTLHGGMGNNPMPLGDFDARVCDACNHAFVIPARLGQFTTAQVQALSRIVVETVE